MISNLLILYLTCFLITEVPVPEAFQNVALSETLEPSCLSDSLKSDTVIKLKQPTEVLASTPIMNRLNKGEKIDSSSNLQWLLCQKIEYDLYQMLLLVVYRQMYIVYPLYWCALFALERGLIDIIHIHPVSRAEESYSTRTFVCFL